MRIVEADQSLTRRTEQAQAVVDALRFAGRGGHARGPDPDQMAPAHFHDLAIEVEQPVQRAVFHHEYPVERRAAGQRAVFAMRYLLPDDNAAKRKTLFPPTTAG
jgi:hypothetical protein